jgi:hypothetical protein
LRGSQSFDVAAVSIRAIAHVFRLVSHIAACTKTACAVVAAARCLDTNSVRALSELQLDEAAQGRLDVVAQKANEGQLTPRLANTSASSILAT